MQRPVGDREILTSPPFINTRQEADDRLEAIG